MCTIVLAWHALPETPLVVSANRDELRTRQSDPPSRISSNPPVYGGRDRFAGGTWLAVTPDGRFCAVTNRYLPGQPVSRDAGRRSRGEIALRVLATSGDQAAIDTLQALSSADYNPVNVIYASRDIAFSVTLDDVSGAGFEELAPGTHVITVVGINDKDDSKSNWLRLQAAAAAEKTSNATQLLELLHPTMVNHEEHDQTPQSATCIHAPMYGTVSSATVSVSKNAVTFRHAEGFPCQVPFRDVPIG